MDQFKDDLRILEIEEAKFDTVTIREVNKAYKKKAFSRERESNNSFDSYRYLLLITLAGSIGKLL